VINFEDSPGGCHKPEGVNPKLKKWVNSTRKSTLDRVLEDRDRSKAKGAIVRKPEDRGQNGHPDSKLDDRTWPS
jgi:hypothetical protein